MGGAAPANAGLGRIALARGEAAKAVGFFEQALAAQPEASSLHHQLSLALAAASGLASIDTVAGPDAGAR